MILQLATVQYYMCHNAVCTNNQIIAKDMRITTLTFNHVTVLWQQSP